MTKFISKKLALFIVIIAELLLISCIKKAGEYQIKQLQLRVEVATPFPDNGNFFIPSDIKEIYMPISNSDCPDLHYIFHGSINRLGSDQNAVISIEEEAGWKDWFQKFASKQNDIEVRKSNLITGLDGVELTANFFKSSEFDNQNSITQLLSNNQSQVTYFFGNEAQNSATVTVGNNTFNIYNNIDSLKNVIAEDACKNGIQNFLVIINPNLQIIDNDHSGDHHDDADKKYEEFISWKNENSRTAKEIEEYLVKIEEIYPNEYRFTLERVRGENTYGKDEHNHEFEILLDAVEKAINSDQGEKLLDELNKFKDERKGGFWKLATHEHDWEKIINMLKVEIIDIDEKADFAYAGFKKWKNPSKSPKEIEVFLLDLESEFRFDYRFTLERVRGENTYGKDVHRHEFEILGTAAEKAIKNKQAVLMLNELKAFENNKKDGFWKLSTHHHDWEPVIEALEHNDLGMIGRH